MLARIPREELEQLMRGYGWSPLFVEGHDPALMHVEMAAALDKAVAEIARIQSHARTRGVRTRQAWPMIVLRSPKGWTGPKVVDGKPVEGTSARPPGAVRGRSRPRAPRACSSSG